MKHLVALASALCIALNATNTSLSLFTQSFINGYGFNPESCFAREYHPFLLEKTQQSVKQLEQQLEVNNLPIDHRIVIMGYENNAIPPYLNCLSQERITDESVLKTTGGWEFAPGNLFGFLTGYLFKDVYENNTFKHIIAEPIELFNNELPLLQQHAFGTWYDFVVGYQRGVQRCIDSSNIPGVFDHLVNFWQSIYQAESKNVSGSSFATQDILFSLYYLNHITQSQRQIKHMFIGPDITYPIEVLSQQSERVTQNAQFFVQRFVQELQPVEEQKTAYVFMSFVDGVGKSTLLGNIRNWLQHNTQFKHYTHVSNASTQRAALYHVNDQVTIVDLPAQISHYCAKPDGAVYIDLGFCTHIDKQKIIALYQYILSEQEIIKQKNCARTQELATGATPKSPEDHVLHAISTLNTYSAWCPFEYQEIHGVFNSHNPAKIRLLVPFDQAHSQGLKIKEPELMIFDKGLHIPMRYDLFLQDLIQQMHTDGIKKVVLVDFLSMYPRTSRETIRINYLLQYLKNFYHDEYDIQNSVYKTCANRHQLYPLFFEQREQFEKNIFLETLMRWVIYDLIETACSDGVSALTTQQVQDRLRTNITNLYTTNKHELDTIINTIRKRIEQEAPTIEYYQYGSSYEAVSRFNVERFMELAEVIRSIIAQYHPDHEICTLFKELAAEVDHIDDEGRSVILTNNNKLDVVARLHELDVDRQLVELIVQHVRPAWYNQLVSLLVPELHPSCKQAFVVKQCPDGYYYLLRYRHKSWQSTQPRLLHEVQLFGLPFEDNSEYSLMEQVLGSIHTDDYYRSHAQELANLFVSTNRICAYLDEHNLWQALLAEHRDMIAPQFAYISHDMIRLVVQALATIHFNVKSPKDMIMVRYAHQDDFIGALRLFELLILPKYLNISTKGQLFDDYSRVTPLVGQFATKK